MAILDAHSDLIREMWENGARDPQILDALAECGVLVCKVTLWKHRKARGMLHPTGRPPIPEGIIERMRRVRDRDNLSWKALSARFGVSHVTAIKYCR